MARSARSTSQLLGDIVKWGKRASRIVHGLTLEDFCAEARQLAISRCVEVIGEAAGRIVRQDPGFLQRHPDIGLLEVYRTRNRLSHGYDTIDWSSLWDTATIYVPPLVVFARAAGRNGI